MKTVLIVIVAALVLSSCSFETSMCPSYGNTNKITSYGNRAQVKYVRKGRGVVNPSYNPMYARR